MQEPFKETDPPRKATILVVDDEEAIRMVEKEVLQELGHEVLEASNGADALAIARERQPHLVLLDLRMPGMTGIEVCQQLRADTRTKDAAIIVVTGLDARVALEESIISGADDFMQKPFDMVEMAVRVRSMLRVLDIPDKGRRTEAYIESIHAFRKQQQQTR